MDPRFTVHIAATRGSSTRGGAPSERHLQHELRVGSKRLQNVFGNFHLTVDPSKRCRVCGPPTHMVPAATWSCAGPGGGDRRSRWDQPQLWGVGVWNEPPVLRRQLTNTHAALPLAAWLMGGEASGPVSGAALSVGGVRPWSSSKHEASLRTRL